MEGLPPVFPKIPVSPSAFCEVFEWNFWKMQFNCGNPCLDHCCHLQRNVTDLWDVTSPGQVMLALPSISTPIWAPVNSRLYHDSFGFACHGKHIPCLQLLLPFLKKTAVAFSASHTTRKTGMRRLIILRDERSLSRGEAPQSSKPQVGTSMGSGWHLPTLLSSSGCRKGKDRICSELLEVPLPISA